MTDNASQCAAITRQLEAQSISAESHAANVLAASRLIAARPDADEPADFTEFGTLAAQFADMLGLGTVAPTKPVPQTVRQHLAFGHVVTRKPVLA